MIDILGYIAGILVTGSLIPQTVKTLKTKSTQDLSLARYLIYIFGLILWIIYASIISAWPVAVMNSLGLILASTILYVKLRYDTFAHK